MKSVFFKSLFFCKILLFVLFGFSAHAVIYELGELYKDQEEFMCFKINHAIIAADILNKGAPNFTKKDHKTLDWLLESYECNVVTDDFIPAELMRSGAPSIVKAYYPQSDAFVYLVTDATIIGY